MLHILSCSPWRCDIRNLIRTLHADDDLLLIQDGVLAAVNGNFFIKIFNDNTSNSIFALIDDIEARGLSDQISARVNIINYTDFIQLVEKQPGQMSW